MRRHHHHRPSSSSSSRRQSETIIALSLPPFVRIGCFIVVIACLSFSFFAYITSPSSSHLESANDLSASSSNQSNNRSRLARLRQRLLVDQGGLHGDGSSSSTTTREHRLAVIIPFIGHGPTAIPSYLEIFCLAAGGSANLVDFLLIHDGVLDDFDSGGVCPHNVIFLSLESIEGFSRSLIRVMDHKKNEQDIEVGGSRDQLARILAKHIQNYPYVLVEFKPALGHIFAEYLDGYSHWGYSDVDILFGDLERWITPDELNDFDIVTYGYGDQDRIYLRGQFTFHKNDPEKINQLWRKCEYLSKMDHRFAEVLSGEAHLHFESAEGCYSAAVLESNDISIKYAVKAFTDVERTDTAYSHGLYVGVGRKRDKTVIYKAGKENPRGLANAPENWFEARGSTYANPKVFLYKPVGERIQLPVIEKENAKCMFWAQKKYQSRLCLDDVKSTDTVYWINGQLYKEEYELAALPHGIASAPFFHFQEWKRYYRTAQLGGFRRNGPSSTFVLSKEGVLPIISPSIGSHFKLEKGMIPSPLARKLFQWNGVHDDNRQQLPHRWYCLQSGPKDKPSNPPTPQCKFMTSWRDLGRVEILSGAPAWSQLDINLEVTLALTMQIHSEQLDDPGAIQGFLNLLTLYLDRWQGQPAVIVIHVSGATPEVAKIIRTKLGPASDLSYYGLDTTLVAAIFTQSQDIFSRKALMNMAMDAAPTRWVVSGYELERGMVMSQDTAYLVHRTAQIHKDSPGAVYVIPQFGVMEGDHDFSVGALELAHLDGQLKSPADLEEGECEGGDDNTSQNDEVGVFEQIENLWWEITPLLTKEKATPLDEKAVEKRALALDKIQLSLSGLLTEKQHYNLYATDLSPILLFDNLGPRPGMITTQMVREIEEFGGKLCYNSLRLAQMATLGYHVNVLAGAFAISTPATRHVIGDPNKGALGVSRCDGCFFFFEEEHEDILEDISLDERKRPAKIAILWEQSSDPLHGHT